MSNKLDSLYFSSSSFYTDMVLTDFVVVSTKRYSDYVDLMKRSSERS